jgi:hypothetical protein
MHDDQTTGVGHLLEPCKSKYSLDEMYLKGRRAKKKLTLSNEQMKAMMAYMYAFALLSRVGFLRSMASRMSLLVKNVT